MFHLTELFPKIIFQDHVILSLGISKTHAIKQGMDPIRKQKINKFSEENEKISGIPGSNYHTKMAYHRMVTARG